MFFLPADSVESPADDYLNGTFETSSVSVYHTHSSADVETSGTPEANGTSPSDDLHLHSQSNGDMIGGDSGWQSNMAAGLTPDEERDRPAMEFLTRKVQMLEWKKSEEEGVSGAALSRHTKPAGTYL